ncbi:hypothetical protein DYU11_04455 [Fibrisoma montanum]|uniref:Adhesin domain-containing protein n=1 Tax=Fibrisoma montanum TaxID=2305895 RepID=A0A418MJH7_9BACT|nr:hypothetical protein [Fibrisoma montanum]RIV27562.1 hypothetical protein DYU11_04455 [Fibrisoma montanum]
MKTWYSLFLCLLPLTLLAGTGEETGVIERRKTIIKLYDVSEKDHLVVDNQFGQVSVELWNRNEIKVQITITANANTEDKVAEYLSTVTIDEKRAGDQIVLRTNIQKRNDTWTREEKDAEKKSNVRIDYVISMPRQNPLTVKNKFGNTNIPMFRAPLKIESKFGNFYASELSNPDTDIKVEFGTASIKEMQNGDLDMSFGSLDVISANAIKLNNKFGKLKIGEANRLNANVSYSETAIGTLRQSGRIKMSFSKGFRIEQLPKTVDDLDIHASYSSVVLPLAEGTNCNFDIIVTHGGFNYPSNNQITLDNQPNEGEHRPGPRFTKQYSGKVGSGNGAKVRVVASYGNVSFK